MENRVVKLETDVKFLRRELESLNLAITRLEQSSTGTGTDASGLTSTNTQLDLLAAREMQEKHQEILKNNTVALVGLNDILEEIREYYRESITDIKLDQREQLGFFQKMLSGAMESLRAEFLMVLRDFREKYPKLDSIAQKEATDRVKTILGKLTKTEFWTEEQKRDLDIRAEQLEQLIGHFIEDSFSSVVELFTYLLNKAETLNYIIMEGKIKK